MPSRPEFCEEAGCPFYKYGLCLVDRRNKQVYRGKGSKNRLSEEEKRLVEDAKTDPQTIIRNCDKIAFSTF